jgi:hypothetical protein
MALDIDFFNRNPSSVYGGMPATMSVPGASNPMGSYFQSQQSGSGMSGLGQQSAAGLGGVGGMGLGFNLPTAQLALGGLETIGNLWMAWQANKLAKEQFAFQKNFAQANMANQISAYNTTLEDRGRSRAFTEGQTPEEAQAYIDDNRLNKPKF